MQPVPHPSKEQVRAYMMQRCHAQRPPPAPDEIRRQLGWYLQYGKDVGGGSSLMLCPVFPSPQFTFVLPGNIAQLSGLLAVEWLFLAAGFRVAY